MKINVQFSSTVSPGEQKTDYIIGHDILDNFHAVPQIQKGQVSSFLVLTDTKIHDLYGAKILRSLSQCKRPVIFSVIPPGEKYKSLSEIPGIIEPFFRHGFNRQAMLIAVGGGVVTDLGGFIASILLRGIAYINVPTTLLAQIDASIGGKTGVDFWIDEKTMYKNMLGRIEQPRLVISDVDTLKTLPERELKSGLGEMVKYLVGWGKPDLHNLKNKSEARNPKHETNVENTKRRNGSSVSDVLNLKNSNLEFVSNFDIRISDLDSIVATCQQIKIDTIQQDPYETKGIRDRLNLGHTIGHGIESTAGGMLSHGESVAIGLFAAARLSVLVGYLNEETYSKITSAIKLLGLPTKVKGLNQKEVLDAIRMDKKGGTFVLIRNIGKLETRVKVEQKYVEQVIRELTQ